MTNLSMLMVCSQCEKPILDKFVLTVLEKPWHPNCVRCSDCGFVLNEKCFSREGKIYCREDFYRRFGPKCGGCGLGISPQDLVRKAREKVFHLKCFTCFVCRKQLLTGEELYVIDDTKFVCKEDYHPRNLNDSLYDEDDDLDEDTGLEEGDSFLSQGKLGLEANNNSVSGELSHELSHDGHDKTPPLADSSTERDLLNDSDGSINGDCDDESLRGIKSEEGTGGTKRRGPRTTIKAKQLEVLKTAFNQTPKPTRHIREQLAKETGLPMRVIQQKEKNPTKKRGTKTTIKAQQHEVLNKAYNEMQKPSRKVWAQLSEETGLPCRVIQVWFQNKRSKERRMKQLAGRGGGFFVGGKRMRGFGLSPHGMEDGRFGFYEGMGPEFGFPGGGRFPGDYFPGQGPPGQPGMPFNPAGPPTSMEQPLPMNLPPLIPHDFGGPLGPGPPDGYLGGSPFPPGADLPPRSTPDSMTSSAANSVAGSGFSNQNVDEGIGVW